MTSVILLLTRVAWFWVVGKWRKSISRCYWSIRNLINWSGTVLFSARFYKRDNKLKFVETGRFSGELVILHATINWYDFKYTICVFFCKLTTIRTLWLIVTKRIRKIVIEYFWLNVTRVNYISWRALPRNYFTSSFPFRNKWIKTQGNSWNYLLMPFDKNKSLVF